jgi:hypothetical protein
LSAAAFEGVFLAQLFCGLKLSLYGLALILDSLSGYPLFLGIAVNRTVEFIMGCAGN